MQTISQTTDLTQILSKLKPTGIQLNQSFNTAFTHFSPDETVPVVAVDCGQQTLFETKEGVVAALRVAAIVADHRGVVAHRTKSGPVFICAANQLELLHDLGTYLGEAEYYVALKAGQPIAVKHQFCRGSSQLVRLVQNFFERAIQLWSASVISDGIILIDGSLTRAYDTPDSFWMKLLATAAQNNNQIVAVSKQTSTQVAGMPLGSYLDDQPQQIGFRHVALSSEKTVGTTYAARFAPIGATYRVDVRSTGGIDDQEVLNLFYSSAAQYHGYPALLVKAHAFSYFTASAVAELKVQAKREMRLPLVTQAKALSHLFGIFGGTYKS